MIVTNRKKNLFFTRCELCGNKCEDYHWVVFERVIVNNKITSRKHQNLCDTCKEENYPEKPESKPNEQRTLF